MLSERLTDVPPSVLVFNFLEESTNTQPCVLVDVTLDMFFPLKRPQGTVVPPFAFLFVSADGGVMNVQPARSN